MARPEVFRIQLRGLLRAGVHGNLWLMIPLVSSLDEVRRFKAYVGRIADELEGEGLECCRDYRFGVMIEVPSAALIAARLASEVDFFSIGTNDLIQYAMAVDRNNEHVADLYAPLHPGLLRLIDMTVVAAREAGIVVSVCGEMASDPLGAPVLLGLGIRRLSMSPRAIPQIKSRIRAIDLGRLEAVARACLELGTASEVEAMVRAELARGAGATPGQAEEFEC
jgi:phosphotransferase system enzyme I (PtsI)